MNTSHYMDKQIMDLSNSQRTNEFIDLINSQDSDHVGGDGGAAANKEEILPSYDFQPLRPLGVSQLSNVDSGNHNGARFWSSVDSKISSSNRNYTSLDSIEPGKHTVQKDHNGYNETLVSEIDQTMKKHADNLLHALEGVSARITQLETRTRHMENSVDDLKLSVGNNQGITDGKLRQLEIILREVQTDVEVVKDKQEIIEAQLNLSKLHIPKIDPQAEAQNNPPPVTASAPLQSLHHQPQPPAAHTQPPAYNPQPPNLHQMPPNQNPPRDPYYTPPPPPPPPSSEPPSQHFQAPPPQQYPPPPPSSEQPSQHFQAPPPQQYPPPPHYSQPPLPQSQNPLPHQLEEAPYSQSQNYRQQPPGGAPPYPQPLYGYDPPPPQLPASRPTYGSGEQFSYGGPQYGSGSPRKSQQLGPSGSGSGYPQLPTARILPHAIPTATGIGGGSGGGGGTGSPGAGNRVPIDDVVDRVTNMGFPRDHVRATVRKLTENGQAVDLNVVLDKLMNERAVGGGGGGDNSQRVWFGR